MFIIGLFSYELTEVILLFRWTGNATIFLVVIIILATVVIDNSMLKISTSIGGLRSSVSDIVIFSLTILVFAAGQYVILRFVKRNYPLHKVVSVVSGKINMLFINRTVIVTAYTILAILILALLQMLLAGSYHIIVLRAIVFISYGLSFVLLALLTRSFFSWFQLNHNSIVLAYAVATSMIAINALIAVIYLNVEFNDNPTFIQPKQGLTGALSSPSAAYSSAYGLTSFLSFVLIWAATVLLMRHYSERLGKTKYWIMVIIPLVYFLSQFQPLFLVTFVEFRLSDPVLFGIIYNLIFAMSKPVGGLLFGIPFWYIAKHLSDQRVKTYLRISAIGIILLFTSNQPTGLILVPYPPYGIVTISFMVLASYMLYLGIYSASLSVSEDARLRRYIRTITRTEAKFLDVIGTAEMEREVQRKVILFSKKKNVMQQETGITSSLNEDDMKKYLNEVLQEVHDLRRKDKT